MTSKIPMSTVSRLPVPSTANRKGTRPYPLGDSSNNGVPMKVPRLANDAEELQFCDGVEKEDYQEADIYYDEAADNEEHIKLPNRGAIGYAEKAKRRSIKTLNKPKVAAPGKPSYMRSTSTSKTKKVTGEALESLPTKTAVVRTASISNPAVIRRQPPRPVVAQATQHPVINRPRNAGVASSRSSASSGVNASSSSNHSTAGAKPASNASRPKWDLRGRLEDMEAMLSERDSVRQDLERRVHQLESKNQELGHTVQERSQRTDAADKEIADLKRTLVERETELLTVKQQSRRDLDNLQFDHETLKRQKASLQSELEAAHAEISGLKKTVAELTSSQAGLSGELNCMKFKYEQSQALVTELQTTVHDLETKVRLHLATIEKHEKKISEDEQTRRKLHNMIQELKGNIRVFCRVRPLLPEERGSEVPPDALIPSHIRFPDSDSRIVEIEQNFDGGEGALMNSGKGGQRAPTKFEFEFDKVFGPDASQTAIFEELCQLIQSALDGYNVCIFAYGQTGSGKTFTMEGPSPDVVAKNPMLAGMIPLSVDKIFHVASELQEKGWQYKFEASFIEIYNETLRDLLNDKDDEQKLEIKLVDKPVTNMTKKANDVKVQEVDVPNLTTVMVTSGNQVQQLLKKASTNRAVAATKCNERSSRSHSVFRLKISATNAKTGNACEGYLNLVDLAGSERLKESQAEGDRLRETQNINKSLSHLGKVILDLANKVAEPHIPFRDSKLTFLLQNSLGGNSKTLMFVNVSPMTENARESLNSLRFATKVNQCQIGTATKKVK